MIKQVISRSMDKVLIQLTPARSWKTTYLLAPLLLVSQTVLASQHSLVIAIDGLRGDGIENAHTPNLDKLITGTWAPEYRGAFAHYAQTMTDAAPNSGPNHVGIMTGVTAAKSRVTNNSNVRGGRYATYPHYQTIIEQSHSGLNTAFFVTWSTDMQVTNQADVRVHSNDAANTQRVVQVMNGTYSTADWPAGTRPDSVFLFLDDVDHAGHSCCFNVSDSGYVNEISQVDGQIGQILNAIKNRPAFASEQWQIVVTSDHGGRGSSHGIHSADNYTIPFLVASKEAGQGYLQGVPHNYDAAPTALAHLGITLPANMDGEVRGKKVTDQAPAKLQQDLVSYLPFEGNYQDQSGNQLHGRVGGGNPEINSGGKFGRFVAINGNREFLTLGKAGELDFGTAKDFTLMSWYRVSGDQSGDPVIIGNKDWGSGSNRGTLLLANEGNGDDVGINIASSGADRKDFDPIDYSFDGWWLLVATFDRDGAATLYAGDPQGKLHSLAGDIQDVGDITSSLSWNIGQDGTGRYAYNLKADLDDFAIWKRALTLDEVRRIYNGGQGLELNQLLNNVLPEYLSQNNNLVVGQSYKVRITTKAKGQTCGLEWDASISGAERNAKWDCAGRTDLMVLKINQIQTQANGEKHLSATLTAQGNKGALEWDASKVGGERNAKFDENSTGDPIVVLLTKEVSQSRIVTQANGQTCGLEWDTDKSSGERNAKWDCAPRTDPLTIQLIR